MRWRSDGGLDMAFGWDGGPLLNYWIACMGQGDIGCFSYDNVPSSSSWKKQIVLVVFDLYTTGIP